MKKIHFNTSGLYLFLILVLLVLSSCIPMKKMKYLQEKASSETSQNQNIQSNPDYLVRPGDNLFIRIIGLDEKVNNYFNVTPSTNAFSGTTSGDASIYLQSYTVNSSGKIDLPVMGPVLVAGINLSEAKDAIQKKVDEYLKGSMVVVKFVSFDITILGEVKNPGKFPIFKEKINIFEAIGLAGDLTPFANRSKLVLVRQAPEKTMIIKIDLTDRKILQSEFFYLKPNDILYAEPLRGRQWAFEAFPYSLIFSTITTTLLIWNFFK